MTEVELHRQKYARPEWERRFLVATMPSAPAAVHVRRIIDRYISGTRLRLRVMSETVNGEECQIYKLTQKIPPVGAGHGFITNLYLSEDEYHHLLSLPAATLSKTRHSIAPMGVDVFDPPLQGLVIAEAEFESEQAMRSFTPPAYVAAEVTADRRFNGGQLVQTERQELQSWLAEYDLSL
jgi:CYTH domain-containing protein